MYRRCNPYNILLAFLILLAIGLSIIAYKQKAENTVSVVITKDGKTEEYDKIKKDSIEIVYKGDVYDITFKSYEDDLKYTFIDVTEYKIKE